MKNNLKAQPLEALYSLNDIADRWRCGRSTARRILQRHSAVAIYLSGVERGIVRFRQADVESIEKKACISKA